MLCGYLILVLEAVRFWQTRERPLRSRIGRFVLSMLQFAVPLALFGYLLLGQSGVGDDRTVYGAIGAKALALLSPTSALIYPVSLVVLLSTLLLLFAVFRPGFAEIDRRLQIGRAHV